MTTAAPRSISPRRPWTAPRIRELHYDEARDRRWQFEAQLERPLLCRSQKTTLSPSSAADQWLAHALDKFARLASEMVAVVAEVRAIAADAAAPPELLSTATVAELLGITKGAARNEITRRGCAVHVGARVFVRRELLSTLYGGRRAIVRDDGASVRSQRDRDSGRILRELEARRDE
jgi:hypothetical protein